MRNAILGLLLFGTASLGAAQDKDTTTTKSGSELIDQMCQAKWQEVNVSPAKPADDGEFLRRVTLDIVGTIPSLEDAEKFLTDRSSDKRAKYIDKLLAGEKYAEWWAEVWALVLVGGENQNGQEIQRRREEEGGLKELFAKNVPYDEFARTLITASGDLDKNALPAYIVEISRKAAKEAPQALAGKFSRVFLGQQIQCAQCHDHPFDHWTQEDFYGMASFLTEVRVGRRKDMGDKKGPFYAEDKERKGRGGDMPIPDSKSGPVKANFLAMEGKGAEPGVLRRVTFAKYMTSPDNLQFAKEAVNRYIGHFFGRGIVTPVDDFNGRNKPTHPALLDALAQDFIAHKYDLKWLIAAITKSKTYQLTSRGTAKKRDSDAEKHFALAQVRGLSPEQVLNALFEATGYRELIGKVVKDGTKLSQMRAALITQFRRAFDDDEGSEQVDFQGTIQQALLMMNSEVVSRSLEGGAMQPGNGKNGNPNPNNQKKGQQQPAGGQPRPFTRLGKILSTYPQEGDRVKAIYVSVLSRHPSQAEMGRATAYLNANGGKPAAYEDLMWSLLNCSEFMLNH